MRNLYKYIQKLDTFQKARQFELSFIHKKPDTLRYAIFHESFEIGIYISLYFNSPIYQGKFPLGYNGYFLLKFN